MRVTTPALLFLATLFATSFAQDDDTSSDAAAPDAASDDTSSNSPSDDASNPDNAAEPEIAALSSPTASVVSDNPEGKVYSAVFPQPTSTSVVTIGSAPNGSADVTVNLNGLPQPGPLSYTIHDNPVASDGSCDDVGGIFNPYHASTTAPCNADRPETCMVGDLSGKHGNATAPGFTQSYNDNFLSLVPNTPAFFGNRSLVISWPNGTIVSCTNFTLARSNGGSSGSGGGQSGSGQSGGGQSGSGSSGSGSSGSGSSSSAGGSGSGSGSGSSQAGNGSGSSQPNPGQNSNGLGAGSGQSGATSSPSGSGSGGNASPSGGSAAGSTSGSGAGSGPQQGPAASSNRGDGPGATITSTVLAVPASPGQGNGPTAYTTTVVITRMISGVVHTQTVQTTIEHGALNTTTTVRGEPSTALVEAVPSSTSTFTSVVVAYVPAPPTETVQQTTLASVQNNVTTTATVSEPATTNVQTVTQQVAPVTETITSDKDISAGPNSTVESASQATGPPQNVLVVTVISTSTVSGNGPLTPQATTIVQTVTSMPSDNSNGPSTYITNSGSTIPGTPASSGSGSPTTSSTTQSPIATCSGPQIVTVVQVVGTTVITTGSTPSTQAILQTVVGPVSSVVGTLLTPASFVSNMVSTVGEPVTTALSEITQVADDLPGVAGATNAVGDVTSDVVPGGGLGGAQTRGSESTTTSTISSGGRYERHAVGAGAGVVAVALCVMAL
ncbi:hypothetical protein KC343_g3793 [Hortaea werneckii]|uniref:Superoxide dismutase copper/zinc binding domain-containing protein n=1 Tax=Hortaea werneckii TaxID=91943 RepID=A0A3M7FM05_HORWE|nr:hypothetical protein KC352_g12994 [Hortaea werneckii]KAI7621190.1 hypothetical protein KC346_g3751 [Hortaea werneckii]KAI7631837.1 hypothetical protein KC343_g3793 [Hortaea werneckii]KAI7678044.1 hypothetical protein KC319_g3570 [Hortaea werneckii]RMY89364.1 hypothetical protein D0864_06447 [Hortaea werneckii]